MKIINKTHWRTDHLRAFVTRVAAFELEPDKRKRCTITFKNARNSRYGARLHGHAWIAGTRSTIFIPKDDVEKEALAKIIAHELAHNRGLRGERDMRSSDRYGFRGNYKPVYAWANNLPLDKQQPKAKPAAPAIDDKIAHVEKAIIKWQRKEKLAKTHLRKWNRKLKYYSKKLAAMNTKPEVSNAPR